MCDPCNLVVGHAGNAYVPQKYRIREKMVNPKELKMKDYDTCDECDGGEDHVEKEPESVYAEPSKDKLNTPWRADHTAIRGADGADIVDCLRGSNQDIETACRYAEAIAKRMNEYEIMMNLAYKLYRQGAMPHKSEEIKNGYVEELLAAGFDDEIMFIVKDYLVKSCNFDKFTAAKFASEYCAQIAKSVFEHGQVYEYLDPGDVKTAVRRLIAQKCGV